MPWYPAVVLLIVAVTFVLGRRRIFRADITRTADDEIVCHFIPWYEGDVYVLNIALPLMAVAAIAASYAPGYPVWLRYGGFLLLALMPLLTSGNYRMWRLSILRITPSALTVRIGHTQEAGADRHPA